MEKKTRLRKGIITLTTIDNTATRVNFDGWREGNGCDCKNDEIVRAIKQLIETHQDHKIEIAVEPLRGPLLSETIDKVERGSPLL